MMKSHFSLQNHAFGSCEMQAKDIPHMLSLVALIAFFYPTAAHSSCNAASQRVEAVDKSTAPKMPWLAPTMQ